MIDLTKITEVHCMGVGGIGMSALARLLMHEGKHVSGCDGVSSQITEALEREGIVMHSEHNVDHVTEDVQLLVYTAAIDESHPELARARELGIPTLTYAQMLGVVSAGKRTVAVAGTHGKTTTTAMIASVLRAAQFDPVVVVGSLLKGFGSNYLPGKGDLFVVEACEYKRSFLNLNPWIGVITNIDNDHLEYYGDMEHLIEAFGDFAARIPENGYLVCDTHNERLQKVIACAKCRIVDYSSIEIDLQMQLPGAHIILDAKAATAVADIVHVDRSVTKKSLESFSGTWRRFEKKGVTSTGVIVYDDYGHHPTEIRATITAARGYFGTKKIIAVFMPHLYSRTKLLLEDFGAAFAGADEVVVADIYPAREPYDSTITSQVVAEKITANGVPAMYVGGIDAIVAYLKEHAVSDNVVMTIGAGDIDKVGMRLLQ